MEKFIKMFSLYYVMCVNQFDIFLIEFPFFNLGYVLYQFRTLILRYLRLFKKKIRHRKHIQSEMVGSKMDVWVAAKVLPCRNSIEKNKHFSFETLLHLFIHRRLVSSASFYGIYVHAVLRNMFASQTVYSFRGQEIKIRTMIALHSFQFAAHFYLFHSLFTLL